MRGDEELQRKERKMGGSGMYYVRLDILAEAWRENMIPLNLIFWSSKPTM